MAFTQITVTGSFQLLDGSPVDGTVTFTPTAPMRNTASPAESQPVASVSTGIVAGTMTSITLAATDDPDTTPEDVTYQVDVRVNRQPEVDTFYIEVPAAGGPINLATAPRAVTVTPALTAYLTQADGDARYEPLGGGGAGVTSVNGDTGVVVLDAADVGADATGTASAAVAAHVAAGDPHPQYLTAAEGNAAYQALDGDLTTIAGLAHSAGALISSQGGAWAARTPSQVLGDIGAQPADSDLTTIAGLTHADDTVLQTVSGAWAARTPAQVKTTLALVKGDVGLGNVDNTADTAKPVSTATQTALDAKLATADAPELIRDTMGTALVAGTNVTITPNDGADTITIAASGGGGAVDSVNGETGVVVLDAADVGAQPSDADLTAIAGLSHADDTILQTVSGAWAARTPAQVKTTLGLVKADVGLSNVDNTADTAKPVSTATQTALDGKQDLDSDLTALAGLSPTNDDLVQRKAGAWTNRTPAQVKTDLALVKGDVGLANVDNTSDANKPVSAATQTALDGKQTLDSDLTAIAGLSPSNDDFMQRKAGAWANRTVAQVRADLTLVPTPASGKYFFPVSQAEGGTPGFGANGTLRVLPWLVERSITVDRIAIEVTTIGDVGSLLRLGIYSDTGAGRPGALLLDAGTVVGDVVGNKEVTISQALTPGIYWIGCAAQAVTTTSPTLRMISDYHPPIPITLDAAPSAGAGVAGYTEAGVTGALPGTFTATPSGSGTMPRLFFRVA